MTKLEQAKNALLDRIIDGTDEDNQLAAAYDILCQTELNERVVTAQVKGGCFSPHCPPDDDDELNAREIG